MNPARFYLGTDTYHGLSRHPYASPLFADHFDHLPPILIQSGGCETMKDEVRAFAAKFEDCHGTIFKHEEYEVFYLYGQHLPIDRITCLLFPTPIQCCRTWFTISRHLISISPIQRCSAYKSGFCMRSTTLASVSRHPLRRRRPHHNPINKNGLHGTNRILSVTWIWICKIYKIRMGFKCVSTESGSEGEINSPIQVIQKTIF